MASKRGNGVRPAGYSPAGTALIGAWLGAALLVIPAAHGEQPVLVSGGSYVLGEQPDGNSVIIHAPRGAIIVDTGRHPAHLDAVLAELARTGQPVAAVINTHWHLDHVGGNPALLREYPQLEVYATDAIQEALSGFLADYRRQLAEQLAAVSDPEKQQPLRAEMALIDSGQALAPNHVVSKSGAVRIAGQRLQLTVEHHAHSGADLWIYDRAARWVISGDLVVLPTPFLDTSCPPHVLTALDHIAATKFGVLFPGHGPTLSRPQFDRYHRAYANLLGCAATAAPAAICAAGWRADLGSLLPESQYQTADALIDYYMAASFRAPASAMAKRCGTV